eukprot:1148211-Pelagomonas_calceolata.AAC.2
MRGWRDSAAAATSATTVMAPSCGCSKKASCRPEDASSSVDACDNRNVHTRVCYQSKHKVGGLQGGL